MSLKTIKPLLLFHFELTLCHSQCGSGLVGAILLPTIVKETTVVKRNPFPWQLRLLLQSFLLITLTGEGLHSLLNALELLVSRPVVFYVAKRIWNKGYGNSAGISKVGSSSFSQLSTSTWDSRAFLSSKRWRSRACWTSTSATKRFSILAGVQVWSHLRKLLYKEETLCFSMS